MVSFNTKRTEQVENEALCHKFGNIPLPHNKFYSSFQIACKLCNSKLIGLGRAKVNIKKSTWLIRMNDEVEMAKQASKQSLPYTAWVIWGSDTQDQSRRAACVGTVSQYAFGLFSLWVEDLYAVVSLSSRLTVSS